MADTGDDEFTITDEDGSDASTYGQRERAGQPPGWRPDVSGGGEWTPSGWRPRVDPAELQQQIQRPSGSQKIDRTSRLIQGFEPVQFVGHLSSKAFAFDKNGDLQLGLVVPYQYKDLAIPLANCFGIPLHVDIQLWKPYADRLREIV